LRWIGREPRRAPLPVDISVRAFDLQHRHDRLAHSPFDKVIFEKSLKNSGQKNVPFANLFPAVGTPPDFGRVVQDHVQQGIMDFQVFVVVDEP